MGLTAKRFSEYYGLSVSTVQKYCKLGKLKDAKKTNRGWDIPEDSVPPMNEERITLLLLSIIKHKENSTNKLDFSSADCHEKTIPYVCRFLSNQQYIADFNMDGEYSLSLETHLTDRAYAFLKANKKKISWTDLLIKYGPDFVLIFLTIISKLI